MSTGDWLVLQNVTLHSGRTSLFKFECDNLTGAEVEGFAFLISRMIGFSDVRGIPTGGIRLAQALGRYVDTSLPRRLLIADDVLTEGTSMACARVDAIREGWNIRDIAGAVMIARGACPRWVTPVLQLNERLT